MKLIYRIALRLSLILIPLMALWATLFYFMMVEEINDEADDTLEDYSELIIIRMLAGRELPSLNSGSNNSYSITPIDEAYASSKPHIEYYDAEVYIPEKGLRRHQRLRPEPRLRSGARFGIEPHAAVQRPETRPDGRGHQKSEITSKINHI